MESLDELRELMTCVVCLDTLSSVVVQCQRGHALCRECKRDQRHCPSCRKPFLVDKPTLLCQIAAIVKGQCKFRGCTYMREKRNDDHQLWCGFMPTDCKLCQWRGFGKDILSHVQDSHHAALVYNGSDNLIQKLDHCIRSRQFYVPFSALGFFFWLQIRVLNMDWENHHSLLAFQVCLVPNGKIDRDLHLTIDFKSDECDYDVRKKIQLKTLSNEVPNVKSCVFIPAPIFEVGGGMLRINVVKSGAETAYNRLDFYNNYNLNRICGYYVTLKNHLVEITAIEIVVIVWVLLVVFSFVVIR